MEDEKKFVEGTSPDEENPAVDETADSETVAEVTVPTETPAPSETSKPAAESASSEESAAPAETPVEEMPAAVVSEAEKAPDNAGCLRQIDERLENIERSEQRLFAEVREMHKLYHSEFAGRLKSMQDELDRYRKIDKGRIFDDILAAIARIYGNNETLVDEVEEPKAKKSIRYMLMDFEELMNMYGMERLRSEPGDKRNTRHCQVFKRIPTDDPEKHDTVAKSYNSGFYIENRTIIKEMVDVYIFEGKTPTAQEAQNPAAHTEKEQNIEAGNIPATE